MFSGLLYLAITSAVFSGLLHLTVTSAVFRCTYLTVTSAVFSGFLYLTVTSAVFSGLLYLTVTSAEWCHTPPRHSTLISTENRSGTVSLSLSSSALSCHYLCRIVITLFSVVAVSKSSFFCFYARRAGRSG